MGWLLAAAIFTACLESRGPLTEPGADAALNVPANEVADAGAAGSAGEASGPGTVSAGWRGPTNLASCPKAVPPEDDADAAPRQYGLGFLAIGDRVTLEGHVSSVAADRMEIETPAGPSTFFWRGPALDTAFASAEDVQLEVAFAPYGAGPPRISIVRSARATAAALDGAPFTGMGWKPGSKTLLQGLQSRFPKLEYEVVSCCSTGTRYNHSGGDDYRCDYSALEAQLDGSSTKIALGSTGVVGPWSVSNVTSSFYYASEAAWSIQVTMLGPATPRGVDAGI